uniref:Vacuolar protein sorting-associated protein 37B n=1 Tax=Schistocephalus solidus TaxID=70667 RepID=A0A0X3P4M7_SCHSO
MYNGMGVDNFSETLANLSKSELEALLDDDAQIKKMVNESPMVVDLENRRKRLLKSNNQKASDNLSLEPELTQMKADLIKAHTEFAEQLESYKRYKGKLDKLNSAYSANAMLELMQAATAEEDEKAEALQSQFLRKEITIDEFLDRMLPMRKLFNTRRVKIDKLTEILLNPGRAAPPRPV